MKFKKLKLNQKKGKKLKKKREELCQTELYNETLSQKLLNKLKILICGFTLPESNNYNTVMISVDARKTFDNIHHLFVKKK